VKVVDITIRIEYDEEKFPESDMEWVADKIAETDELYNIGYDFDSFQRTSTVIHSEV
jgi:hypothetical protein